MLNDQKEKGILKYETESNEFDKNGVIYVCETTYRIFTDETQEIACVVEYPKLSDEFMDIKEQAQLDRDEILCDIALNIAEIRLNQEIPAMGGETE